MRLLARDGIVSGESGAAGLAGLLDRREQLGLDATSTVLTISTEGATDPVGYAAIVGREPGGGRLMRSLVQGGEIVTAGGVAAPTC